jgi:ribose 5-phosphate isomerase A
VDQSERAERQRREAGAAAAEMVPDGATLGYGTGRAATAALEALAVRVRAGLRVRGVPTSKKTAEVAQRLGLPIVQLCDVAGLDMVIDGADEVDEEHQVLKGGGGALTREKLVALAARERVLVLEESKRVHRLGSTRGLPIEIIGFGWPDGSPTTTDNGGLLCDAPIPVGADLRALAREVKLLSGVVEHGLFLDLSPTLVVGGDGGTRVLRGR